MKHACYEFENSRTETREQRVQRNLKVMEVWKEINGCTKAPPKNQTLENDSEVKSNSR